MNWLLFRVYIRFSPLHFRCTVVLKWGFRKAGHWGYTARRSPFHEVSRMNETFFGIFGKENPAKYTQICGHFLPGSLSTSIIWRPRAGLRWRRFYCNWYFAVHLSPVGVPGSSRVAGTSSRRSNWVIIWPCRWQICIQRQERGSLLLYCCYL